MRKSIGSFVAINRSAVLLLGVVLSMTVFGVVVWRTGAETQVADISSSRSSQKEEGVVVPGTNGKALSYQNGVIKIEPEAFGITSAVRDLPTFDPDAAEKVANYKTRKQIRQEIIDQQRIEKGLPPMTQKEKDAAEINEQNVKTVKKIVPGAGLGDRDFTDPLLANNLRPQSPQVMPTPGLTFDGATQVDNAAQGIGAVLPPDVNGDVGLNHYVSSVNLVYKIFNKNGTVAAGPFRTSALFSGLPATDPCRTRNDGDPVVVYDSLADRWHISQFAVPANPNNFQCVAVSVTNDPTGAYYVWRYTYPGQLFNDYPKVGVWPDAYHMTFNQFNNAGTAFLGAGILSQDRPKALAGDPTASAVYRNIAPIDPNASGLLPVDIDGLQSPPVGMAAVMAEYRADEFGDPLDAIRYYRWVPDFVTPASSTLTVLPDVALAAFDARQPTGRGDIEQSGGANLDSISDRMMHMFKYRNLGTQAAPVNSFVGSFAVNVSGVNPTSAALYQTGIRWFEMRRTAADVFSVFDQGTHNLTPGDGASGLNNWMGSIAQDNRGDIALGFSQSSTTQNADIKIAGRTVNTMNSGILNEGEALFFDALGSQTSTSNRWGDYSSMNVDPVDDCTFWYTQEYYATTSAAGWSTRVGRFIYPTCTPAQRSTISGTITFAASGLPVDAANVSATGGFQRQTGAPGTYSMTVAPGTYTVSANKGAGLTGTTTPSVTVANGQTVTANIALVGAPVLTAGTATVTSGNTLLEPNECNTLNVPVTNIGGATATAISAVLSTTTPGITVTQPNSAYADIPAGGGPINNTTPFQVSVANSVACFTTANFTLTVTFTGAGGGSPAVFNFSLPVGIPGLNYAFTSGAATIPAGGVFVAGSAADDAAVAVTLPAGWASTVYGTPVTSLSASTNGAMTVNGAAATTFSNTALPGAAFGIGLFPYWDDLILDTVNVTGGGIYANTVGVAPNRQFYVEWRAQHYSETANGPITTNFAILLTEGSDVVRYIYTSTGIAAQLNGASATVGVQAASTGTQFTQFSFNTASLSAGLQLTATRPAGVCTPGTGTCNATPKSRADFDGDGKTDLSVFRPSEGNWYLNRSTAGFSVINWGISTDTLVPGDFDGDGKADTAVFRPVADPAQPDFFILNSNGFTVRGASWGLPSDVPISGDYDGDSKTDVAVFRPSNGTWYILNSSGAPANTIAPFGQAGDVPMAFDLENDGKTNLAVYRPGAPGSWYIARNTGTPATNFETFPFGTTGDLLVPADYDGDDKDDAAVFRPSNGTWYIRRSTNGAIDFRPFGLSGDVPVPGDYDGDGSDDIAVYRGGTWYVNRSTSGLLIQPFGLGSDRAIPKSYIP